MAEDILLLTEKVDLVKLPAGEVGSDVGVVLFGEQSTDGTQLEPVPYNWTTFQGTRRT